jgi:integrase
VSNIIHLPRAATASPMSKSGKVRRWRNADRRLREHLTPDEVEKLIAAARRSNRWGHRDATLILIAWRHGMRVSELVGKAALQWSQIEFKTGLLHVRRLKKGERSTHPLQGDELRALRQLRRDWPDSPYVFVSERGSVMSASNVRKLVQRLGRLAGLGNAVHPHQLRHACGYALIQSGEGVRNIQLWLGHKNIQHTTRYAALSDRPFSTFWRR